MKRLIIICVLICGNVFSQSIELQRLALLKTLDRTEYIDYFKARGFKSDTSEVFDLFAKGDTLYMCNPALEFWGIRITYEEGFYNEQLKWFNLNYTLMSSFLEKNGGKTTTFSYDATNEFTLFYDKDLLKKYFILIINEKT